jgi:hypothetical protein
MHRAAQYLRASVSCYDHAAHLGRAGHTLAPRPLPYCAG